MSYYELHRNMQTGDLTGAWIGTNEDGMSSDDGVFEFVFVPVVGPVYRKVPCEVCIDEYGEWRISNCGTCDSRGYTLVEVGEEGQT